VAINPQFFAPGFEDRMSSLMDYLRNMEPVSHSTGYINKTGSLHILYLNIVAHSHNVYISSTVLEA
jgi:hypothetical protein